MALVHGTCVDVGGTAVLLRGPPGSGKSDLALRLIDGGARLVADDQVELRSEADGLVASAPPVISGSMEVRGIGLLRVPSIARGRLRLVIDLVAPEAVDRMPEPGTVELAGVSLPHLRLHPFEVSACAKVRLAARAARGDGLGIL